MLLSQPRVTGALSSTLHPTPPPHPHTHQVDVQLCWSVVISVRGDKIDKREEPGEKKKTEEDANESGKQLKLALCIWAALFQGR